MKDKLLNRLKEKSTIATIVTLVGGGFGVVVTPEASGAIAAGVIAILGLVGVVTPEAK